ncbi:MAG: hypothetical protein A3J40_12760 [Erythrobacter sp. RIFCSPHIGHO2_12_FULL_63_10]|nr:MAG: hypothetical protein A3J40_12760 [Erythrobacter sp. RIFCSPHIGHO2_12_FULL_63_10]
MATHANLQADAPGSGQAVSLTRFIDRWIYVFMAAFMTLSVLVGFVPDSLDKVAAVEAGLRPPFPLALHLHAVLMGSWMLLLLTQTTLMATGRKGWHMQLGVAAMVLAPALVIAGVVLVPTNLRSFVEFTAGAPAEMQAQVDGFLRFMTDIALIQLRAGLCFLLLVFLALRARKRDSGLHKRLIILATMVPMPAAFDRMAFLPNSMPASPLTADIWPLVALAPMFLWDLYRQRRIHRAYWIYAAVMIPAGLAVNMLWGSDWWHSVAPGFLYG